MRVRDVYPRRLPDLFVGRPVLITGRFEGDGPATIRVTGRVGYEEVAFEIETAPDAARHEGITKIWARRKLRHLADLGTHEPSSALTEEMIATSLEYSVQCRHTAFVAVDSSRRTKGDHGVTIVVPVPVPDGVRYETTVNE
jgi:Ca-activated chloride channel family protein